VNGFLEELGKKAAERWLALLVLPGLVWSTLVLAAVKLSHRTPFNLSPVADALKAWVDRPHSTGVTIIVLAGVVVAGSAAGAVTAAIGIGIRRMWTTPGRRRPARCLVSWRQWRWKRRNKRVEELAAGVIAAEPADGPGSDNEAGAADGMVITVGPELSEACARRDALSLEEPTRPTWIGDRWRSTVVRVNRTYGLDLTVAWPRLWSVLPDSLRGDISAAQTAYANASMMMAWAVLYLIPTIWWWPAAVITAGMASVSVVRGRACAETLCSLIETAVDLHIASLAERLREPDRELGLKISAQLRKELP
jgi:hypothetical protein